MRGYTMNKNVTNLLKKLLVLSLAVATAAPLCAMEGGGGGDDRRDENERGEAEKLAAVRKEQNAKWLAVRAAAAAEAAGAGAAANVGGAGGAAAGDAAGADATGAAA